MAKRTERINKESQLACGLHMACVRANSGVK
jgi:hypothetical protein